MHLRVGLATVLIALVLAPVSAAAPASAIIRLVDVGSGAREAWVFLPEEPPDCVLAFVHDDGDLSPARYTSWLDYTVLRHRCAVVFPRYQLSPHAANARNLGGLRAGVAAGLAFVRKTSFGLDRNRAAAVPLITAGFGSGGTLALTLAARAHEWGFPPPVAVDTVFPVVNALAPLPTEKLGSRVHVLVQVGDRDRAAGPASVRAVRRYLSGRAAGLARIQVVHSSASLAAIHSAPLRVDTAAENAFWGPLDTLIDGVTP
jgi:acetyl esterase/lipase